MSGALPADRDRPRVDADQVGAGAYTPDGPGAVVATRTLDDGAVVACLVEAGAAYRAAGARLQVGSDGALLGCDGRRVVGDHP